MCIREFTRIIKTMNDEQASVVVEAQKGAINACVDLLINKGPGATIPGFEDECATFWRGVTAHVLKFHCNVKARRN